MSRFVDRTGEVSTSTQGQKMTIINYRNRTNIDVRFEDNTIVFNRSYIDFLKGHIKNPNFKCVSNRLGESSFSSKGQLVTIVRYNNHDDIDVRFEDGTIVYNRRYNEFIKGYIKNPNYVDVSNKIGKTSISSKGEKMTLIAWRSYSDIDVQFEDGTVVREKSYRNFMLGHIANPNNIPNRFIGLTNIHKVTGLKMTIVAYRNSTDIDVRFEDGITVYNKRLNSFKRGVINHDLNGQVGKKNIAKNGLNMVVKSYRSHKDIDVEFEDGSVIKSNSYCFKTGSVKHPTLRFKSGYGISSFTSDSILFNFSVKKLAYTLANNTSYYICKCKSCLKSDILSVSEMREHICKK